MVNITHPHTDTHTHTCAYMHACMHTYINKQVTDLGDGTYAFDYLAWDAGMHKYPTRPRNRLIKEKKRPIQDQKKPTDTVLGPRDLHHGSHGHLPRR